MGFGGDIGGENKEFYEIMKGNLRESNLFSRGKAPENLELRKKTGWELGQNEKVFLEKKERAARKILGAVGENDLVVGEGLMAIWGLVFRAEEKNILEGKSGGNEEVFEGNFGENGDDTEEEWSEDFTKYREQRKNFRAAPKKTSGKFERTSVSRNNEALVLAKKPPSWARGKFENEFRAKVQSVLLQVQSANHVKSSKQEQKGQKNTQSHNSEGRNGGKELNSKGILNSSQLAAIESAMWRRLTVWQGPPGTGKTTTILRYILAVQKLEIGQVLAVADRSAEKRKKKKKYK